LKPTKTSGFFVKKKSFLLQTNRDRTAYNGGQEPISRKRNLWGAQKTQRDVQLKLLGELKKV